jgi:NAD(P) transhydrogenase subunit beta
MCLDVLWRQRESGHHQKIGRLKSSVVMKRSMAAGFAGIEIHLFYKDNTRMLFGDAKASLNALVAAVKAS